MGMETEHLSLSQILNNFNQIIIPDVQRDYVMGSGGEKLIKLLTAMAVSNDKEENFNFSCLVGYKDKDNCLYIYDGQQRLATLVCLCSYLNNDMEIQKLLKKFSFMERELANEWLSDPTKIRENNIVDFTTYSLSQLVKEFDTQQIRINYIIYKLSDKIKFEFLFKKVFFDMVLVNEISDAEQFFLDINDGLDLKSYEIYKAELYHHAAEMLDKEAFKFIALKMENEWLNFFLQYAYKKRKLVDGAYKDVVIYEEEEILIFFLQYCFRMMWIEEKGCDTEFELQNISWLQVEHLRRVEQIVDVIINVMNDISISDISCINYSYNKSKGQHWNIIDRNYIAMLKAFLKNVYNAEEINKDVIIWCYISKLPFVDQNENSLYKYLRFVKMLLNNNRKTSNNAEIFFGNWGVESKEIVYARYYVQGVPQYYTNHDENEEVDESTLSLLNEIVILNKGFTLDEKENFVDVYLLECKNNFLKNILDKEQQKQNSHEKEIIEMYENLWFTNGLVDNFLIYEDGKCQVNDLFKNNTEIFAMSYSNEGYQYRNILKFINDNKIDMDNSIFNEIFISWKNYCDTKNRSKGDLIPHTWCDLFTNEKGINFNIQLPNNSLQYLPILPDGWIFHNKIIQPMNSDVENTTGFASYARTLSVLDMSDLLDNYSWISKGKNLKYILDGEEVNNLPIYLASYEGDDNWITNKLSIMEKVFFSEKKYLNLILLHNFMHIKKNTGEDVDTYLEKHKNYMFFHTINSNKFFIKSY